MLKNMPKKKEAETSRRGRVPLTDSKKPSALKKGLRRVDVPLSYTTLFYSPRVYIQNAYKKPSNAKRQ